MSTQKSTTSDTPPVTAPGRSSSAETTLGFAVMGCCVAGSIAVYKAMTMTTGAGVLLCVLAAIAAFGTVAFIYLRKD